MERLLTPGRAIVAAGVIGFVAALLTAVISGIPVPQIHDEFSYLLAADTYAHGRLTNPPHPLWPWFETFHVLQQPTYMSKYPPGQGVFLALGQLIGLPIAGAWLSAALACAAVTWMLLPWMSERWALGGGVLLALHPAMLGWSHSYWGAAVSILGGALTIGGARNVGRVLNPSHIRDSILLGLGIVILANSRPWEGFILVATLMIVAIAMRLIRWRALVPAAIVVVLGGLFILYDNWRVTHHPLLMPYVLYERQYNFTPPLIWQKTHPVVLRQKTMEYVTAVFDFDFYQQRHSPAGFLLSMPKTLAVYANSASQFIPDAMIVRVMTPWATIALTIVAFMLQLPLWAPMFFVLPAARRDRTLRAVAIVAVIAAALALFPVVFPLPHYAGPLVPLFILLWLAGVRELGAQRVIAAFWVFGVILFFVENRPWRYRWDEVGHRLAVERSFDARPGRHVVLVHYLESHNPHFEWVQNAADIDAAHVVWAHDMTDNAPLLRDYSDRRVWLLTVGDRAPALESYEKSRAPGRRQPATPGPAAVDRGSRRPAR